MEGGMWDEVNEWNLEVNRKLVRILESTDLSRENGRWLS